MARLFALVSAALVAVTVAASSAVAATTPLVSVDWLKARLNDTSTLVVDLRASNDFEAGHVPGAVNGPYPDLWRKPDWQLPPVDLLVQNLSALGVGGTTTVVLVPAGTDATELGGATFAYWVLKYLGHENVAVLDGGWYAWKADATAPVANGASAPTPASFTANLRPGIRATTDQVAEQLGTDTVLIDARSPEQYLGKTKSRLVSRAGRIPGAVNLPYFTVFDDATHRLKPRAELAALVPAAVTGKDAKIIAYCNTGHWSSIDWFVLHELLGYDNTRLYDGSMAAWTRDPSRPVETGQPESN